MAGTKRKTIIPKACSQHILMDAGAKRVSRDAIDTFTAALEHIAEGVGHQAVRIAKHSGRKTVTGPDIKLAVKK